MKTSDLSNWIPVLKYQNIAGPVDCPTGTNQRDQCVESYMSAPSVWCCLEQQLGITSTAVDCTGPRSCTLAPDGPNGDNTQVKPAGCCDLSGGSGSGAVILGLGAGALLLRRKHKES
jgi:hypothetical protein